MACDGDTGPVEGGDGICAAVVACDGGDGICAAVVACDGDTGPVEAL
jgi:hypothetical protein